MRKNIRLHADTTVEIKNSNLPDVWEEYQKKFEPVSPRDHSLNL